MVEKQNGEIFSSQLFKILNNSSYASNRNGLADALGIKNSSLSQYLSGKTKPSFKVLVKMSEILGVSLDYLVFGEIENINDEAEQNLYFKFLDSSLSSIQAKVNANGILMSRISHLLMLKIQEATEEAVKDGLQPIGGIIGDEETMRLEYMSRETLIISRSLMYDIKYREDGKTIPGSYTKVMADNIKKSFRYKFLLPGNKHEWVKTIHDFREVLATLCGSSSMVNEYCQFRTTDEAIFSGLVIYQLNNQELEKKDGFLHARLKDNFIYNDYLGYTIPPSSFVAANTLMDEAHLKYAIEKYNQLFKRGRPL